jgi:8-oxo-dGTP pyrophosphatase MutT (NUDIX family)
MSTIDHLELVDICVRRESDGKFLAVTNRKHEGWTFPGGKIDPEDASPGHAALRELEEEAGLVVDLDELEYVGVFTHRWRGTPVRCYSFVVPEDAWDGQVPFAPEAGTEILWVSRDDLLDDTSGCIATAFYGWFTAKKNWND